MEVCCAFFSTESLNVQWLFRFTESCRPFGERCELCRACYAIEGSPCFKTVGVVAGINLHMVISIRHISSITCQEPMYKQPNGTTNALHLRISRVLADTCPLNLTRLLLRAAIPMGAATAPCDNELTRPPIVIPQSAYVINADDGIGS